MVVRRVTRYAVSAPAWYPVSPYSEVLALRVKNPPPERLIESREVSGQVKLPWVPELKTRPSNASVNGLVLRTLVPSGETIWAPLSCRLLRVYSCSPSTMPNEKRSDSL